MASIDVRRDRGYNREAARILALPSVRSHLQQIAGRVRDNAGPGHAIKNDTGGRGRVRVQVYTQTEEAKVAEARDKSLSKAFAAERKQPRRYL